MKRASGHSTTTKPTRKRVVLRTVAIESNETIDLEAWARGYVAAVLEADRERDRVAGVVMPIAEAS